MRLFTKNNIIFSATAIVCLLLFFLIKHPAPDKDFDPTGHLSAEQLAQFELLKKEYKRPIAIDDFTEENEVNEEFEKYLNQITPPGRLQIKEARKIIETQFSSSINDYVKKNTKIQLYLQQITSGGDVILLDPIYVEKGGNLKEDINFVLLNLVTNIVGYIAIGIPSKVIIEENLYDKKLIRTSDDVLTYSDVIKYTCYKLGIKKEGILDIRGIFAIGKSPWREKPLVPDKADSFIWRVETKQCVVYLRKDISFDFIEFFIDCSDNASSKRYKEINFDQKFTIGEALAN